VSTPPPIASPADVSKAADHATDAVLVAPWPPGRITDGTRSGAEVTADGEGPANSEGPANIEESAP
jgi:hypothetical protein